MYHWMHVTLQQSCTERRASTMAFMERLSCVVYFSVLSGGDPPTSFFWHKTPIRVSNAQGMPKFSTGRANEGAE